jgi:hypothetical protein
VSNGTIAILLSKTNEPYMYTVDGINWVQTEGLTLGVVIIPPTTVITNQNKPGISMTVIDNKFIVTHNTLRDCGVSDDGINWMTTMLPYAAGDWHMLSTSPSTFMMIGGNIQAVNVNATTNSVLTCNFTPPPAVIIPPVVTVNGTTPGSSLTCTPGTWSNGGVAYWVTWIRSDGMTFSSMSVVAGAYGYTLSSDDCNNYAFTCKVRCGSVAGTYGEYVTPAVQMPITHTPATTGLPTNYSPPIPYGVTMEMDIGNEVHTSSGLWEGQGPITITYDLIIDGVSMGNHSSFICDGTVSIGLLQIDVIATNALGSTRYVKAVTSYTVF